ncbi:MAG TPA: alpha/beta hydrolase [Usitatibacter sp.]|jgi:pimeloyl-ACP methyl ester carboxylesterase|nr:alpha/beta hydrolase [Usitatibacter sp.]
MSRIPPHPPTHVPPGAELEIPWDGRRVRIEHAWIEGPSGGPLIVFLHEGLGCVAMWRDFPARLCAAAGARGLLYSRPGYGRSSGPTERQRDVDYLHRQAYEVLPALLDALGVAQKPWLFGHSDGGSIGLLFAARFPQRTAGLVVMAPHIFVEDATVQGVRSAVEAYEARAQRARLAGYHADADAMFRAWASIWLDPRFRGWNIEREIEAIRCPVLAIQGRDDEYATLDQVRGIARRVPRTRVVELPDCTHSPQRERPEAVIEAVAAFMEDSA